MKNGTKPVMFAAFLVCGLALSGCGTDSKNEPTLSPAEAERLLADYHSTMMSLTQQHKVLEDTTKKELISNRSNDQTRNFQNTKSIIDTYEATELEISKERDENRKILIENIPRIPPYSIAAMSIAQQYELIDLSYEGHDGLTSEQILALNPKNLTAIMLGKLAKNDSELIKEIIPDTIEGMPDQEQKKITHKVYKYFDHTKIQRIHGKNLTADLLHDIIFFNPNLIKDFTPDQIYAMPDIEQTKLKSFVYVRFNHKQTQRVRGKNLSSLTLLELANYDQTRETIKVFTPDQIGDMTDENQRHLWFYVYDCFDRKQLQRIRGKNLSANLLNNITRYRPHIISNFTPSQIGDMPSREKNKMDSSILRHMTPEQKEALLTHKKRKLVPSANTPQ